MALDLSFQGRCYPPTRPYEVGREKIREFADALGDPDPVYRDPAAARRLGHPDVIAPPTFPIVLTLPAGDVLLDDPELGLDFSRVVHGEQQFDYHRPVHAGDRLCCTVTVERIRSVAGNDLITTRTDVATVDAEPVAVVRSVLVVRGKPTPDEEGSR